MTHLFSVITFLGLLTGSTISRPEGDVCHVYLLDVAVAKKTIENFKPSGNREQDAKTLQAGVTVFPEFETEISEEVFTTKHFRFPKSNLVITASIFYTDESMVSRMGEKGELNPESMLLGLAVSGKELDNAIYEIEDNVVSEVNLGETVSKIRVKKNLTVNKQSYIVGLECDCNAKRETVKK